MGTSLRELKPEFTSQAGSLSILVVDDYEPIRDSSIMLLNAMGYMNTHDAEDGRAALEILRNQKIDVVISDIDMPVMNGFELMRAMRADAELAHVPVIAISGRDSNKDAAIRCGATRFLVKGGDNFEHVLMFLKELAATKTGKQASPQNSEPQPGLTL